MIKNLTKIEYYRSKNIPTPKICLRLNPEVPVRHHMLDMIPNLSYEVLRIAESNSMQNELSLEILQYHKIIHQMEERIHTLMTEKISLEEESMLGKKNKEASERKIASLEKEILSLKDEKQRVDYENRIGLEGMQRQFQGLLQMWERKYKDLQGESNLKKKENINDFSENRKQYESKFFDLEKDYSNKVNMANISCQNYKKELSKLANEGKRLREELIKSQTQNMLHLRKLEDENFKLNEKLMRFNAEADSFKRAKKEQEIYLKNLNSELTLHIAHQDKIKEQQRINFQKEKLAYDLSLKDVEDRARSNYDNLLREKDELFKEMGQLNKKYFDLDKNQNQKVRRIEELEDILRSQKTKNERDIKDLHSLHEQKIKSLSAELDNNLIIRLQQANVDSSREITRLLSIEKQKYDEFVNEATKENDLKIKNLRKQIQIRDAEIRKLNEIIEKLNNELKNTNNGANELKWKLENLTSNHINQKQKIVFELTSKITHIENGNLGKIEDEKRKYAEEIKRKDLSIAQLNDKLKGIDQIRVKLQSQLNTLKLSINQLNEEKNQISNLLLENEKKYRIKENQMIELRKQISNATQESNRKEALILNLRNELTLIVQKSKEGDNIRLQNLKKFKESQEAFNSKVLTIQNDNIRHIKSMKFLEDQRQSDKLTLKKLKEQLDLLEKQLQICRSENIRLKSNINDTVSTKNGLIQQLRKDYQGMKIVITKQFSDKQASFTKNIASKDQIIDQMSKDLRGMEGKIQLLSEEIFRKDAQITKLRSEGQIQRGNAHDQSKIVSKFEKELIQWKNKNDGLLREKQRLVLENGKLLQQSDGKLRQINDLIAKLKKIEGQNAQLQGFILSKNGQTHELTKVIESLKVDLEKGRENLQKAQSKAQEQASLKIQLQSDQIYTLEQKVIKLQATLVQKQSYQKDLLPKQQAKIASLQNELAAILKKLKQTEAENNRLTSVMLGLKDEVNSLTKDCQNYIKEKNDKVLLLDKERNSLLEVNTGLSKKIEDLQKARKEWEIKYEEIHKKIAFSEDKRQELERSINNKQKEKDDLEGIIIKLQSENRNILATIASKDKLLTDQQALYTTKLNEALTSLKEETLRYRDEEERQKAKLKAEINSSRARMMEIEGSYSKQAVQWTEKYSMLMVKYRSNNKQLIEYKKKWARICGEVSDFSFQLSQIEENEPKIEFVLQSSEKVTTFSQSGSMNSASSPIKQQFPLNPEKKASPSRYASTTFKEDEDGCGFTTSSQQSLSFAGLRATKDGNKK